MGIRKCTPGFREFYKRVTQENHAVFNDILHFDLNIIFRVTKVDGFNGLDISTTRLVRFCAVCENNDYAWIDDPEYRIVSRYETLNLSLRMA